MIEAALSGSMGSLSPSTILAGFGNMFGRLNDVTSIADQGAAGAEVPAGRAAAFERALAEELRRAGGLDPLDIGFDLQNGTFLGKVGETEGVDRSIDPIDSGRSIAADAADKAALAGPYRRVNFDADAASAGRSAGGHSVADRGIDPRAQNAFWVGDRVVSQPALCSDGSSLVADPSAESVPTGRVFFNGDGRPIVLPPVDLGDRDMPAADDGQFEIEFGNGSESGDLMILPDGAVLAYDPWTVAADGSLQDAAVPH